MRRMLLGLGLALTGACCGGEAAAPPPPGPARTHAQRITGVEGLENLARVAPGIYRGAQPTKAGLAQLKAMGVKTVISLRSWHSEKELVEGAGLRLVPIPMHADVFGSTPPKDEDVARFLKTLRDPAAQPVYFHCAHGKDRTGTMAAVYRMEVDGWTAEEAISEMQAFGYHDIYRDLIHWLRAYRPRR